MFDELLAIEQRKQLRVFGLSDLHSDRRENLVWLQNLRTETLSNTMTQQQFFDVLIVAGDVATDLKKLEETFTLLVGKYDAVFYTPGNHELWLTREDKNLGMKDSIEKLAVVLRLAKKCGVRVAPTLLHSSDDVYPSISSSSSVQKAVSMEKNSTVMIFPLLSWYHTEWDREADIVDPLFIRAEAKAPFVDRWMDFAGCSWPPSLLSQQQFASIDRSNDDETGSVRTSLVLAEWFAALNTNSLQWIAQNRATIDRILSFSHYLPKQICMPEKRFLFAPHLSRVSGSLYLERQVDLLRPDIHLFGHTHIPMDCSDDNGVRFVQWPLGNTRETSSCKCVRDVGPILLLRSVEGSLSNSSERALIGIPEEIPSERAYWSVYYRENIREPNKVEPISGSLRQALMNIVQPTCR